MSAASAISVNGGWFPRPEIKTIAAKPPRTASASAADDAPQTRIVPPPELCRCREVFPPPHVSARGAATGPRPARCSAVCDRRCASSDDACRALSYQFCGETGIEGGGGGGAVQTENTTYASSPTMRAAASTNTLARIPTPSSSIRCQNSTLHRHRRRPGDQQQAECEKDPRYRIRRGLMACGTAFLRQATS